MASGRQVSSMYMRLEVGLDSRDERCHVAVPVRQLPLTAYIHSRFRDQIELLSRPSVCCESKRGPAFKSTYGVPVCMLPRAP